MLEPNDFLSGKTAADMLLAACGKDAAFKCGKGVIIRFPRGRVRR